MTSSIFCVLHCCIKFDFNKVLRKPGEHDHNLLLSNNQTKSKPWRESNTEPTMTYSGKVHSMVMNNKTDATENQPSDSNIIIDKLKSDLSILPSLEEIILHTTFAMLPKGSTYWNPKSKHPQPRHSHRYHHQQCHKQTRTKETTKSSPLQPRREAFHKMPRKNSNSSQQSNFEEPKNIAQTEGMELNRLWTAVSEARLRIASLEQERIAYDDKIHDVKEEREKTVDKCYDLEAELQKAKEGIDSTHEGNRVLGRHFRTLTQVSTDPCTGKGVQVGRSDASPQFCITSSGLNQDTVEGTF
jgi:hypothetical protein